MQKKSRRKSAHNSREGNAASVSGIKEAVRKKAQNEDEEEKSKQKKNETPPIFTQLNYTFPPTMTSLLTKQRSSHKPAFTPHTTVTLLSYTDPFPSNSANHAWSLAFHFRPFSIRTLHITTTLFLVTVGSNKDKQKKKKKKERVQGSTAKKKQHKPACERRRRRRTKEKKGNRNTRGKEKKDKQTVKRNKQW